MSLEQAAINQIKPSKQSLSEPQAISNPLSPNPQVDIMLSEMDKQLIAKLESLPEDYWDFKSCDTQELTHGLHAYPAVMIYPISRKIIEIVQELTNVESLLDPFAGSGTVPVEGTISGISKVYGNDLNPLARLLCRVKTTPIAKDILLKTTNPLISDITRDFNLMTNMLSNVDYYVSTERGFDISDKKAWAENAPSILNEYLATYKFALTVPDFKNIGFWFKPRVILSLQIIKNHIRHCDNEDVRNFLWLTFSDVVRSVSNRRSGEFKMYRRPAEKLKDYEPDVLKTFISTLERNVDKMGAYSEKQQRLNTAINVHISADDSCVLSSVPNNSVDLLVTSPPYGDSRTTVAYGQFSRLSLQWLDLKELTNDDIIRIDKNLLGGVPYKDETQWEHIGSKTLCSALNEIASLDKNRAYDVFSFYLGLDKCIHAATAKMKLNTYQFWVVGNRTVKLKRLETDRIIRELAHRHGLTHIHTVNRDIQNKVMPSLNSPTNKPGEKVGTMTNEHIVILKKIK